jgi:hypothetical protein
MQGANIKGNQYITSHHLLAAGNYVPAAHARYAAHIVLDLETLSTQPNAAVASIGAAALAADGTLLSSLHVAINDQGQHMRHIDEIGEDSTVQWWSRQEPAARAASVDAKDAVPASAALGYFGAWVAAVTGADAGESDVRVWGNSAVFDNVILRTLYRDCHPLGYAEPWQWRFDRDMRTLLELYPAAKDVGEFVGIKHHAEHDALHEAKQLAKVLKLRAWMDQSAARAAGERAKCAAVAEMLPKEKDIQTGPQLLNTQDRRFYVLGWNECRAQVAAVLKGGV